METVAKTGFPRIMILINTGRISRFDGKNQIKKQLFGLYFRDIQQNKE